MNPSPESEPLNDGAVLLPLDSLLTDTVRIPITEEQLQVSRQTVETGRVRLAKTVHETDETVTVPLLHETYTVERIALNQYVDEPPATRQEGETTIYPVVNEVLVVQKRLVLIEEIRVTRLQAQVEDTQTMPLRREEITVERTPINPERPV